MRTTGVSTISGSEGGAGFLQLLEQTAELKFRAHLSTPSANEEGAGG